MGLFSFKERKPKRFEYKPYYYDPEKEDFNERVQRLKRETGLANDTYESRYSYKGRRAIRFRKNNVKPVKTPKVKLLIIVIAFVLLLLMFYIIGILTTYLI